MSEPRLRSDDRNLPAFQSLSAVSHNGQTDPVTPAGVRVGSGNGSGRGKSSWTARATERTPMREVYADELAWAEKYLPDEYGPFVALAIERVRGQGLKPSTQTVMAQLKATRRDAVSCAERAKKYGGTK